MKKWIFSIAVVFMILCSLFYSFAYTDLESLVESEKSKEYCEEESYILKNCEIKRAYQVKFLRHNPITIIKEKGFTNEVLSDIVQWKIPSKTKQGKQAQVVFSEKENSVEYLGYVIGERIIENEIDYNDIVQMVREKGFNGDVTINIYYSPEYASSFAYFVIGEESYIVPYLSASVERETNIDSGVPYKSEKILNIFDKTYDEKFYQKYPDYNGGPILKEKGTVRVLIVCVGAVAICGLVLLFMVRNRKKEV